MQKSLCFLLAPAVFFGCLTAHASVPLVINPDRGNPPPLAVDSARLCRSIVRGV